VLNNEDANWESPVPRPEDYGVGEGKKMYMWDEDTTSWQELPPGPSEEPV
jgi:hypothetical protein